MIKLDIVIVLYNTIINDSKTFNSLECYKNKNIIIIDNSKKEIVKINEQMAKNKELIYYSMNGNKGLSKAYNKGLDFSKEKFIMFMDDDSMISENFEMVLNENIEKYDADLYFPLVATYTNKEKIVRPILYDRKKVSTSFIKYDYETFILEKQEKFEKSKNLKSINSGMVIKKFSNFSYDERFFLGYIDYFLVEKMLKNGKKAKILNSYLYQDFSIETNCTKSAINRFKVTIRDIHLYLNMYCVMKNVVYLTLKYKSLKFLKIFLKYLFMKNKRQYNQYLREN